MAGFTPQTLAASALQRNAALSERLDSHRDQVIKDRSRGREPSGFPLAAEITDIGAAELARRSNADSIEILKGLKTLQVQPAAQTPPALSF